MKIMSTFLSSQVGFMQRGVQSRGGWSIMPRLLVVSLFVVVIRASAAPSICPELLSASATSEADSVWAEEQLYFGALIPTGGIVTDSLWEDFLDHVVTPRFPKGYTTLNAVGRYRDHTGESQKEPTRIIIVNYDVSEKGAERKILDILTTYKDRFSQEYMLRVTRRTVTRFY